jgi:hypothetical protein
MCTEPHNWYTVCDMSDSLLYFRVQTTHLYTSFSHKGLWKPVLSFLRYTHSAVQTLTPVIRQASNSQLRLFRRYIVRRTRIWACLPGFIQFRMGSNGGLFGAHKICGISLPVQLYWLYCCFTLEAGLLARSQYAEGPATGQLGTGFSWFPCV